MRENSNKHVSSEKAACADQYSKFANSSASPLRDRSLLPEIHDPYQPRSCPLTNTKSVYRKEMAILAWTTTLTDQLNNEMRAGDIEINKSGLMVQHCIKLLHLLSIEDAYKKRNQAQSLFASTGEHDEVSSLVSHPTGCF